MSQNHLGSGRDFMEALASYDEILAGHNLGVLTGASLVNKGGTKRNILITAMGIVVGAFTGFGFYRTAEADTGNAVLANDGIHFFPTSTKKIREDGERIRRQVIDGHSFIGYNQVKRAVTSARQLNLIGTAEDVTGRDTGYRLTVPLRGRGVETLKGKLEEQGIKPRKSRAGKVLAGLILAFIAFLLVVIFLPRWTNSYRAIDYSNFRLEINAPTSTSAGRYQDRTTSFAARIATDVFTIDLGDGHINFVGAEIAGNDRIFLLELSEGITAPKVGYVANITAIGRGAIATRPRPEQTAFDRFFESVGIAFGDPRVSGVVAEISNPGVLRGTYYLHMRATEMEAVVPIVLGESDTYISAGGNFQITLVDAFFTTSGAGQRQTDVIVIFFDYEALASHGAGRPFNRFTVYQGDIELERNEGGIRAAETDGRGFLATQHVEAGEVFRAMGAVVAHNIYDPITIVIYGAGFDILFMYKMNVR